MPLAPEHWGWPRLVEQAAAMEMSASRLRTLVSRGECPAVRDGREWRVDPAWCAEYARTRQGHRGRYRRAMGAIEREAVDLRVLCPACGQSVLQVSVAVPQVRCPTCGRTTLTLDPHTSTAQCDVDREEQP